MPHVVSIDSALSGEGDVFAVDDAADPNSDIPVATEAVADDVSLLAGGVSCMNQQLFPRQHLAD